MQTFLPYPDFIQSAKVLDNKRLGKQRVEAYQILMGLFGIQQVVDVNKKHIKSEDGMWLYKRRITPWRWLSHPATKMWKHHEACLMSYIITMCDEWTSKGFRDNIMDKSLHACAFEYDNYVKSGTYGDPFWLHNTYFHVSHQSNLIRKDPIFYSPKFPNIPNNLPYIWPAPTETLGYY